jgi:hypothetical protein
VLRNGVRACMVRYGCSGTTHRTVSVSINVCCFSSPLPRSLGNAAKRPC